MTTTYRYAVNYTDSHGDPARDEFETIEQAAARETYLHERNRPAYVEAIR